ncbi:hypothetical protein FSARC_505 [Fusarium sarcochroum]|uniref:Uncharacterized protein n=1 Tax=Fusarium sarcochroum TaxID=1208366 RepID=A0A8H4UB29_9HYPO|nr:hypothetical protein FSARC_505 [Fusarium sarcochroum]
MAGGKRCRSEGSSSSRKAPKNTSTNTPNKDSTKCDDLTQQTVADDAVAVSGDQTAVRPQDLLDSGEANDEVLTMPGDFTDDDYKSLVHTAFRFIGRDADEHAELIEATVDWMMSTNFFATKTWSHWTGEKKLYELLRETDRKAVLWPSSVIAPAAQFTIPAFIMLHLMKDIELEPTDESFKLLERHNIFRYLGQSIDLWKELSVYEIISIGLRPHAEPKSGIKVARLEPILPRPAICDLSNIMLLSPYPRSTRFVTSCKQITSEEWLALNQDWLAKLGDRHFDNAALKDKIAEQVTSDTAPLIPEEHRNKLWFWFGEFNKAGRSIIDVEFKSSVEIKTRAEDLTEPEHPVEQSLRRIESSVGELPETCLEQATRIKYEVNRLFAYHEVQSADNIRFKDEFMRAAQKVVNAADKLPVCDE